MDSNAFLANSDEWKVVQKKGRKSTKSLVDKMKGASLKSIQMHRKPADVFVSRLNPNTTIDEVKSFVSSQFKSAHTTLCQQLKTRYDTYASFYVQIDGISFNEALNLDNWPEGVLVKRFYKRDELIGRQQGPSTSNVPDQNGSA